MANKYDTNKKFGKANTITMIRILFIPVFIIAILAPWPEWFFSFSHETIGETSYIANAIKPWVAAIIYAALALTDSLDGYVARKNKEVSTFGKFIDPLADKLLVTAALLALVELGDLPSWVAFIIIAREFIVSGIRMLASSQGRVLAANSLGKTKTVVTIIAILLFIVKRSTIISELDNVWHSLFYFGAWAVMIIALTLTIVSMIVYIKDNTSIFKEIE